jgi:hypothetical protein
METLPGAKIMSGFRLAPGVRKALKRVVSANTLEERLKAIADLELADRVETDRRLALLGMSRQQFDAMMARYEAKKSAVAADEGL